MVEEHNFDDIVSLLESLPPDIRQAILEIDRNDDLLEIVMDLGRPPSARYTDEEIILSEEDVTQDDIYHVVLQIGDFDADNRAGLEKTLHRISAIRNRKGEIVGLTVRLGRAIYGTIEIVRDIVESGKSILILGKPGVGKTTMLREAARILAENKRVVIVDTSNEIGGDGDIPHPAVGRSRRMQVPKPTLQHEVMIEAVENHNPEVIVIDEIGRELEAMAARTIAERGVQLIGTAHGITLENLLLNPTLSDLIGGIESVTLSDEEARRRGTQKTVLERRAPPTFEVLIELQDRDTLNVQPDVALAVDMLLRGFPLTPEVRRRNDDGEITIETPKRPVNDLSIRAVAEAPSEKKNVKVTDDKMGQDEIGHDIQREDLKHLNLYPYAVARNRLIESSRRYRVPIRIVDTLREADALITLKNFYRKRPRIIADAEKKGIPIYVLRSNSVSQIDDFLVDFFKLDVDKEDSLEIQSAMKEVGLAIEAIRGGIELIDLKPQRPEVRRLQHELVRQSNLSSNSLGQDPDRYVRVYSNEY